MFFLSLLLFMPCGSIKLKSDARSDIPSGIMWDNLETGMGNPESGKSGSALLLTRQVLSTCATSLQSNVASMRRGMAPRFKEKQE